MVRPIRLRRIGGSLGATLPKAMTEKLNVGAGDRMFAVETPDGILLTPFDPDTQEAIAIAARAVKKYRHALRELAK
jgi:putative addiction module antidote